MGTYHQEFWISDGAGQSRRQRASGAYEYYLPTPLADRDLSLDADVVGDVASAESAIRKLNADTAVLHSTEGVARILLRAETVSSSHIEGLTIGARRLLRSEFASRGHGGLRADPGALEVLGNIRAMEEALRRALGSEAITRETFCEIHRVLCKGTPLERWGGIIRDRQNWIGGNSYNPLGADFIPPAPEHVPALLDDLAAFCSGTAISPIEQAAVAHAQFENIHPFADGNGRTGRVLIHLILRRRGLAENLAPPVSLVLATHAKDYIAAINGFAFDDEREGDRANAKVNDWVSLFAGSCRQACAEAVDFEQALANLRGSWEEALGRVRAKSALDVILGVFPGTPVFDIALLEEITGRSFAAISQAVDACLDAGVVRQITSGKRNRIFEVPDIIAEYTRLERKLASPAGDTAIASPVRPVPARQ